MFYECFWPLVVSRGSRTWVLVLREAGQSWLLRGERAGRSRADGKSTGRRRAGEKD